MKNKLTKKQLSELDELAYDAYEFAGRMLTKIEKKTKEGVKGWKKMDYKKLLGLSMEKTNDAAWEDCDKVQIIDAANYLFFAWIKAGKP